MYFVIKVRVFGHTGNPRDSLGVNLYCGTASRLRVTSLAFQIGR